MFSILFTSCGCETLTASIEAVVSWSGSIPCVIIANTWSITIHHTNDNIHTVHGMQACNELLSIQKCPRRFYRQSDWTKRNYVGGVSMEGKDMAYQNQSRCTHLWMGIDVWPLPQDNDRFCAWSRALRTSPSAQSLSPWPHPKPVVTCGRDCHNLLFPYINIHICSVWLRRPTQYNFSTEWILKDKTVVKRRKKK